MLLLASKFKESLWKVEFLLNTKVPNIEALHAFISRAVTTTKIKFICITPLYKHFVHILLCIPKLKMVMVSLRVLTE